MRRITLLLICIIALAGASSGAFAAEGYDPLRIISAQLTRPAVYILLDCSGSMVWEPATADDAGNGWSPNAVDYCGQPVCYTSITNVGTAQNGKYKEYDFTFQVFQGPASRMSTVKNALGSSVSLWSASGGAYVPPAMSAFPATSTWPTAWKPTGWTSITVPTGPTITTPAAGQTVWTWVWQLKSTTTYMTKPTSPPFTAYDATTKQPLYGTVPAADGLPQDVVGNNKDMVDWGLIIMYGASDCTTGTNVPTKVAVDLSDSGVVDVLEAYLKASTVTTTIGGTNYTGLGADKSTPTRQLLAAAQTKIKSDFALDPKYNCGRTYATILVTDGLSNLCNPSGKNWIKKACDTPCPTGSSCPGTYANCGCCPGQWCCDVGSSGFECTASASSNNWTAFPPGVTKTNWTTSATHTTAWRLPIRTWVIGVSTAVSACELNWNAYMGRTDASDPTGSAGFKLNESWPFTTGSTTTPHPTDNRLPQTDTDVASYDASKPYAYFATSAGALGDAFRAIVGAIGQGDYTTSSPVVSGATGNAGDVSLLASSEFPGWKGHLYAYSLSTYDLSVCTNTNPTGTNCLGPHSTTSCNLDVCTNVNPTCANCVCPTCTPVNTPPVTHLAPSKLLWDAGANLSYPYLDASGIPTSVNTGTPNPSYQTSGNRKIYTWDASNTLVEITDSNKTVLNGLCSNCGITSNVVDFIRGNKGDLTNTAREWKLGSSVNSTPSLVAGPVEWKADQAPSHVAFESQFAARHPVIYLGSDDGMIHVFDAADGYEILALLTPDNLVDQVTFYNNYKSNASAYPTGQPTLPADHKFGVENSPRFQDIWFSSENKYKTVFFLVQGSGSRTITAIDITAPYPGRASVILPNGGGTETYAADPTYSASAPVKILWKKSSTDADYTALKDGWSLPAVASTVASTTAPQFEANMGSGWNSASVYTSQVAPTLYTINAADGSRKNAATLAVGPYTAAVSVGDQAFADCVMWSTTSKVYQEGTAQNLAIQVDLNGRMWFLGRPSGTSATPVFDASTQSSQSQPIYYPPAVAGYKSKMCLAFATGSYFEKSTRVNGSSAVVSPSLYIIAKGQDMTAPTTAEWKKWKLSTLVADPVNAPGVLFSTQATVVAAPIVLVPNSDSSTDPAIVLFGVYDPVVTGTCVGNSYVVKILFDPSAALSAASVTSTLIGSGAISGFAVAGGVVIVAKSGVGADKASTPAIPGVKVGGSQSGMRPVWWRELQ